MIFKCISLIPLCVQYYFSDILLYPLVYHVAGYRVKVVRKNLKNSFPDKSDKDLKTIEKRFYHHFCDCFFESVHILSMSKKESTKRLKMVNSEVVTDFSKSGKDVILLLGHYGNWEFQNFVVHYIAERNQVAVSVYMPLKNKAFDYLYLKIRTRFNVIMVTKKGIYHTMLRLRKEGKSSAFGMISDQSPAKADLNYWTKFLNQDSAIITGPERLAKQLNLAVVYLDVTKLSRGYYKTEYILITDNPQATAPNEITEQYARCMEKTILKDPAYWLWTHKRWKHKRIDAEKAN